MPLAEMARERGAQYRSLQETDEGRELLEKRFQEQKEEEAPELSSLQKENLIRKQLDHLQKTVSAWQYKN